MFLDDRVSSRYVGKPTAKNTANLNMNDFHRGDSEMFNSESNLV